MVGGAVPESSVWILQRDECNDAQRQESYDDLGILFEHIDCFDMAWRTNALCNDSGIRHTIEADHGITLTLLNWEVFSVVLLPLPTASPM
jgi:hypothetical protein